MTRVLLTTTSFQDTPGPHHQQLKDAGFELVVARGPLPESEMLKLVGDIDAFLCGDDEITCAVIQKALPRLKVISKYGIGLDKVDVKSATEFKIPVTFCPGVNHTTVSEHCFLLLLALTKNLMEQANASRAGQWKRMTGHEILGKSIGIIGLGRIGKEVAIRARAFGMNVIAHDIYWDEKFAAANRGGMATDRDGAPVFLAKSAWEIGYVAERFPNVKFVSHREFGDTYGARESEVIQALPGKLAEFECDLVISGTAG